MADLHQLHDKSPIYLEDPFKGVSNDDAFRFNGAGDYRYETFIYDRNPTTDKRDNYSHAKVDHRPYAPVVCAALIILKHHMGDDVRIKSDDYFQESAWHQARQLYINVFDDRQVPEYFHADNPDHNVDPNVVYHHMNPFRLIAGEIGLLISLTMDSINMFLYRRGIIR